LDGLCTDRGANLSGGQRQLVALARSFVFDGAFLLLDEPTSSMDAVMEAQFIKNMRAQSKDKTLVLVTHKPALLNACERIIVVEAGRIAWDGDREQYIKLINERKAAS
jgi:ATP-binding cassette subfamily C protein LapB